MTRGRIFRDLEVDGARHWALFDSGARRSYVTRAVASRAGPKPLAEPVQRALGGTTHDIRECCTLVGTVEGHGITADTLVVERLFPDETGRQIEVIIGAQTLVSWGIGLDMTNKRLDFTHYQREAIEG